MSRDPGKKESGSRRRRYVLIGGAVLLLALALDAAYAGVRLSLLLYEAREPVTRAVESARNLEVQAARENIEAAERELDGSEGLRKHPGFVVASWLPFIGNDVRSLGSISRAAELATNAGAEGVAALDALGVSEGDGGLAEAILEEGRIRFDAVEEARPFLARASRFLAEADEALADAPDPSFGPLAEALDEVHPSVQEARSLALKGLDLMTVLPPILGERGPRRYFLAFQAPGEMRGTGGFIGSYGVLVASRGRLELARVDSIRKLVPRLDEEVEPPTDWFEATWGPLSSLSQWQNANLSPNFPAVSEVLLDMYEVSTGEQLDGVIAMDPGAVELLLPAVGEIRPRGFGRTLDATNARRILTRDIYTDFDERSQNAFLAQAIERFWSKIAEARFEAGPFAKGIADAVAQQHLKVYSTKASDEQALLGLGAGGDYENKGPNPHLMFHNNFSASKIDVFAHRSLELDVRFEGGDALVTAKASVRNDSPTNLDETLIGPSDQRPGSKAGENRMMLSLLLPEGAVYQNFEHSQPDRLPIIEFEGEHITVSGIIDLDPGVSGWIRTEYVVPDVYEEGEDFSFPLTLIPQPAANPDRFWVRFAPPSRYEVMGDAVIRGRLVTPVTFRPMFAPDQG